MLRVGAAAMRRMNSHAILGHQHQSQSQTAGTTAVSRTTPAVGQHASQASLSVACDAQLSRGAAAAMQQIETPAAQLVSQSRSLYPSQRQRLSAAMTAALRDTHAAAQSASQTRRQRAPSASPWSGAAAPMRPLPSVVTLLRNRSLYPSLIQSRRLSRSQSAVLTAA